jgi:hypothetical protein
MSWSRFVPLALVLLASRAVAQDSPLSHRDLDWQAPNRWVHVDNLDTLKAPLFVEARLGWLAVLRTDDGLLGDGRALFWEASTAAGGRTFFSFYPFDRWSDLDVRREMILRTQGIVGDGAVATYDAGDVALISPHYSQVWRRARDLDVAAPAVAHLDELTAAAGRLEVHTVDITRWDEFEGAWRQAAEALVAGGYPLACRVFRSSYGKGEYLVWWLAGDATGCREAPSVREALDRQLGPGKGAELLAVLEAVFPLEMSYDVARRPDLCNLGK